jgi:hypothetical protein
MRGRSVAQVVSRQPLPAEDRVQIEAFPHELLCDLRGTGTQYPPSTSGFSLSL